MELYWYLCAMDVYENFTKYNHDWVIIFPSTIEMCNQQSFYFIPLHSVFWSLHVFLFSFCYKNNSLKISFDVMV